MTPESRPPASVAAPGAAPDAAPDAAPEVASDGASDTSSAARSAHATGSVATRLVLPAPAKLNLFLHVTGRRPDGYHLLETVFQFIDLADTVTLARRDDGRIERRNDWAEVAADSDLAVRAARALQAATGCRYGADITVDKRIPTGAGLGGGSSDAATVLLGLNRLWGLGLSRPDLQAIGLGLGADVPIFVFGRNAYATGIGEILAPVDLPARWYVLAMPPTGVATGSVFAAADLTRDTIPITISGFSSQLVTGGSLPGRNDLEPVVLSRHATVAATIARLRRACETVGVAQAEQRVRMTGSGACVFALAENRVEAQRIADAFAVSRPDSVTEVAAAKAAPDRINQFREPVSGVSEARSKEGPAWVVAGLSEHPLGSRQVG